MEVVGVSLVRELMELQRPARRQPLAARRRRYDLAEQVFEGAAGRPGRIIDATGCTAEWVVEPSSRSQTALVYLHGGGYRLGSLRSHRHLARALGEAAGAGVLSAEYRLAPECPFPAAVEDAVDATCWLLESHDGPVVLIGDSAGGGLVIATLVRLSRLGHPLPAGGVCLSPWVDLTGESESLRALARRDPLLEAADLRDMASDYLAGADAREPLASPLFADLRGLPPLLVQVGGEEILLDDARRLAARARAADVEVTLEEWPQMVHVWHWYFPLLREGRQAIAVIGEFVRSLATSERRQADEVRIA